MRAAAAEIEAIAKALALEQSIEAPRSVIRDDYVRDEIVGQVSEIRPIGKDEYEVGLALATVTTGLDPAQTLNMLFGNSSLHAHVVFQDAEFPDAFVQAFGGPRFGITGLRDRVGVHDRPLTCGALKPQGLSAEALGELCYTLALGGVDIIKDDHGLADQSYSPFAARVRACQQAVMRANRETGRNTCYAPSLVGSPRTLAAQAQLLREEGVAMALVAPMLVGMPAFHELVRDLDVPVLAHPAFAGAARIAPAFLYGKLFRLLGADAVIYPNHGGRFGYSPAVCRAIAQTARASWSGVRPALPVPAGGMTVERVEEMSAFYGRDAMLLIGGGLLEAGDALLERTRDFVTQVAAAAVRSQTEEERHE